MNLADGFFPLGPQRRGKIAETLAVLLLRLKLYRILDRNYRTNSGEIDIIAKRGNTLAFFEVKARGRELAAALAIDAKKQSRIRNTARRYLALHPNYQHYYWRGDAILFYGFIPHHLPGFFQLNI